MFLYKTLSDRCEYDARGKVFKKMCLNIFSRNDQPCISLRKRLGSLTRQSTGNKSISKSSENVVRSDKIRQNSGNTSDSINCMNSPILLGQVPVPCLN